MTLDYTGKTILVTGATRGIGKQIADHLALLGANLILTGTNKEQIAKFNNEYSGKAIAKKYLHLDFTDSASVKAFIDDLNKYDHIDCLVNNAGINRLNTITDVNENDWADMLQTNLTGPYLIIKSVAKKMIANNYGRILNIASIFSKISKEKRATYSATKFGLHGLTVGVSNDLARFNVLVNTLSPGFVMTDLTRKNLSQDERAILTEQIPIKRMAAPEDIANVAIFLLSEKNTYLTGQNIVVDGGFTNV